MAAVGAIKRRHLPDGGILTAGKWIMENSSSCGLKLISLLFYRFIEIPA
jgi:hypothetical protein